MATFWFYIISYILSKGLFGLFSLLCLHFIYINIIIYYPCLQFVLSVLIVNCGGCSSHAVTAIGVRLQLQQEWWPWRPCNQQHFSAPSWVPGNPQAFWNHIKYDKTNRTISSAKGRDAILRSPNRSWNHHSWDTFSVWLPRSCSLLQIQLPSSNSKQRFLQYFLRLCRLGGGGYFGPSYCNFYTCVIDY